MSEEPTRGAEVAARDLRPGDVYARQRTPLCGLPAGVFRVVDRGEVYKTRVNGVVRELVAVLEERVTVGTVGAYESLRPDAAVRNPVPAGLRVRVVSTR